MARTNNIYRRDTGEIVIIILLTALAFIALYPFIWILVTSFKPKAEVISYPPKLFSGRFSLDSYINIWKRVPFLRYYRNTIILSTAVTVISLAFGTMTGYTLTRMSFPGKNIMFLMVMGTMMIPFQAIIVPLYIEIFKFGLINTYPGLVLPRTTNAFGIFMVRSFFISLPEGLEEAGWIDGYTGFGISREIMVPLCKPVIASLFISRFIYQWNDLLYPLLLATDDNMKTLPSGLATFMGAHVTEYDIIMAGACLSLLPILIAYFIAQKQFVQGIATTGMRE